MTASSSSAPRLSRWQRSLLPAVLGADHSGGDRPDASRLPRTLRDWAVDAVLFIGAIGVGAAGAASHQHSAGATLSVADAVLGIAAVLSLWVRRRWPFAVALGTILASTVSAGAGGAGVVALFTATLYCVPRRTGCLFGLALVTTAVYPLVYTPPHHGYAAQDVYVGGSIFLVAVVFGAFVRTRREVVLSLHDRNRRLRDEQALRVNEARLAERNRIAREMHDVLAHRISLLSVHAGALEFHPDAPPAEIARAAAVIRENARAAQEELRDVVGVLRTGAEEGTLEPPQPTLDDLQRLVTESREAGMNVELGVTLTESGSALAPMLGRTVYRIVQEALTNVRKHAPDDVVVITLGGRLGHELEIEIVNRPRVGAASRTPGRGCSAAVGSGTGLIGLGERIALAGGTLAPGRLPGGGFRIRATLPWTAT